MSEKVIKIRNNLEINTAFINANRYLINKYSQRLKSNFNKEEVLKTLWFEEFKADLIKDNISWTEIRFSTENDLLMFTLKYQ